MTDRRPFVSVLPGGFLGNGRRRLSAWMSLFVLRILCLDQSIAQNPMLGDAVDATQLVWTSGGNAEWFGQTNVTHDGVDAACTGDITFNQSTWMETITSVTGHVIVAFWWKVSSEWNYDFLSFSIDGVEQLGKISGSVGWHYQTHAISSGAHVLRWSFTNDLGVTNGANAGWVDQVQILAPPSPAPRYVWEDSPSSVPPFTNWTTAAHTIQEAVDVAAADDTIWVTNGVYGTGGGMIPGYGLLNRVAITKPITVQSVNGRSVTVIQGDGPCGDNAVRCVYVGANAMLSGFTLTNGHTRMTGISDIEQSGGGAWCEVSGVVSNCTLTGNAANYDGGGACGGTLNNCALTGNIADHSGGGARDGTLNNCRLTGNSAMWGGGAIGGTLNNCTLTGDSAAYYGGGAYEGTLNNCTLTGNSVGWGSGAGGGAYGGTLNNCIVYYNTAQFGPNCSGGALSYCCTTPDPGGTGNTTSEPRMVSASHIAADSPCVGKGSTNYVSGVDVDGEPWRAPPSIGADEPYPDSATGSLSVAIGVTLTSATTGYELPFLALIQGRATRSAWDFGDGSALTNRAYASHTWSSTGTYAVVLTAWNADYPDGVSCTTMVSVVEQPIYYADVSNPAPAYPYTNWTMAATNIQQAIDADSTPGRLVLVRDGVYEVGGRSVHGTMTNRVALIDGVTVRSVNGPTVTVIQGEGPLGEGAVRCAYVGANAVLSGFTLTNGCTRATGDGVQECSGGGAWCEVSGVVSDCTLIGNSAAVDGGGAYGGTLNNCVLVGNSAGDGGGARGGTLNNCTLVGNSARDGGGARGGTLNDCTLTGNIAAQFGGGAIWGTLNNCRLTGNTAYLDSGGAGGCTLNNCTLTGNSATRDSGGAGDSTLNNCTLTGNSAYLDGGGAGDSSLNNCIVYYNTAQFGPNCSGGALSYCCTTPDPGGTGNTTSEPRMVSASHIAADSPCVGKGSTNYVFGVDIDGEPWRAPPSIGADEPYPDSATGSLSVAIGVTLTSATTGYELPLLALIQGGATGSAWDFGDGSALTNRAYASHTWSSTGTYAVVLTAWNADYPDGVSCTTMVSVVEQPIYYADISNPAPAYPYTNWTMAATNIQEAIDADSTPGRLVLVRDGVYEVGGRSVHGSTTNRVALIDGVTVRSVNGPSVTQILGEGPLGDGAVRCAYVGANAVLSGFTLTNGCTRATGDGVQECSGGGAWCEVSGVVSDCTLIGNSAAVDGGGAYGGTLNNCVLVGNSAPNYAGGGAYGGTLNNCTLAGNSANYGGGAYSGTLNNCTLTDNAALYSGGAVRCALTNCILYYNTSWTNNPNYADSTLSYCCTWPASGVGCVTNAPEFVAPWLGDYRLSPTSPCADAGINQEWMFAATDLSGNPRILNGTVDMGAYETPFTLYVRALLQGAYDTNSHAMATGSPGNIPLTSPYANDPRTVAGIPSNAVDWVLVELAGTNGNTAVSKSAFLDTGGQLLASDGSIGMTAEVSAGYYSVVLKHRNHLAAMSATPVAFTNILTSYDFTTGGDNYLGGTNAAVELEPGVWGLIAGDGDGDGMVYYLDASMLTNQFMETGYNRTDFNLDGTVDNDDFMLLWSNMLRESGASDALTPLVSKLTITPQRKTVLNGVSLPLLALGLTNAVNWNFVSSASAGSLSASSGTSVVYTAGMDSTGVDIVQAWLGNEVSRSWINVISPEDAARAGKAIVIAGGKGPSDTLGPVTDYLADYAYNTLLYRGYAKDNVRYLNPETGQDVDGNGAVDDVAAMTTMANAAATFTNWATAGADRLFVYLVDHGGTNSGAGYFRLNTNEVLTATELDGWLDGIQASHENDVVVVLDFCKAGSFLDALKYTGPGQRTVIAACDSGEETYFLAGGLVSFSGFLFGAVFSGLDLAEAFDLAKEAMGGYQSASLDADGDGLYEPAEDVPRLAGVYLGPSFIAGKDIPQIGHVMGGQLLQGATAATLWAYDIASAYDLERVWCMVVPPGHDPNPDDPVSDLPILDLTKNPTTSRYEAQYSGFTERGTYKLVYYAQDEWGSVSLPRISFVQQASYDERMVLVAGGSTNDPQWSAVTNLAAVAYRTAMARRLGKPALRYLSVGPPQDIDGDGTNDVAAAATLSNLGDAITAWSTNSSRLTVYVLGSSTSNGLCRLSPTESLPAAQLDGWLDTFQATNATAALVVMDFDGCGSYVPSLAPPPTEERIVIASAKAEQPRMCAENGLISFSGFFLKGIFIGWNLGEAFNFARDNIKGASNALKQTAQLDDNGNGVPGEKGVDGLVASTRYLGSAFVTGADVPFIGAVTPTQAVVVGTPLTLWASTVLSDAGISNAWCVITPPDYDGSGDLPQTNLAWSATSNRYEAPCSNFTLPGTYALTFFALANDGSLSAPVQSLLSATDAYEPDDAPGQAALFQVGDIQRHNFHAPGDGDWVFFYAPSGHVFNVDATQLGTNSDLVLELYCAQPDGDLLPVDSADYYGAGSNITEHLQLGLKLEPFDGEPGIYCARVGGYDTNLFGPSSEYELKIYEPVGGAGGVIVLQNAGPFFQYGDFSVSMGPPEALPAGAAWQVMELGGWYTNAGPYALPVPNSGSWHLSFQEVPGFWAPAGQTLSLQANGAVTVPAAYIHSNLLSRAAGVSQITGGVFGFSSLQYPDQRYVFEESTNLLQWVPIATNQVPGDGALRLSITNWSPGPGSFYRWRLIR